MATWTEPELYNTQTAIAYNASVQYNSPLYTYSGRQPTTWTESNIS